MTSPPFPPLSPRAARDFRIAIITGLVAAACAFVAIGAALISIFN